MDRSGTTALVFLGTCLGFAEVALGTIAGLTDPNATLIALFALFALGMVLVTLGFMYKVNPGFLTIGGQQASELAIIQTLAETRPEVITPEFLLSITSRDLVQGESEKVDEGLGDTSLAEEAHELLKEFEDLQGAREAEGGRR